MAEYFRRKRLKELGLTEPIGNLSEYEQEVILYIDSQIDSYRDKKAKRDSKKGRSNGKR